MVLTVLTQESSLKNAYVTTSLNISGKMFANMQVWNSNPMFDTFWLISQDSIHIFQSQFLCWNHEFQRVILCTMTHTNGFLLSYKVDYRLLNLLEGVLLLKLQSSNLSWWVLTHNTESNFIFIFWPHYFLRLVVSFCGGVVRWFAKSFLCQTQFRLCCVVIELGFW